MISLMMPIAWWGPKCLQGRRPPYSTCPCDQTLFLLPNVDRNAVIEARSGHFRALDLLFTILHAEQADRSADTAQGSLRERETSSSSGSAGLKQEGSHTGRKIQPVGTPFPRVCSPVYSSLSDYARFPALKVTCRISSVIG
jgi:hypothetical protein